MSVFQDNLGKTHGLTLNLPTKKNKVSYTGSSHHTWPIFSYIITSYELIRKRINKK